MNDEKRYWPKAIILVDMNAFFAGIEQRDFPQIQGQPVVITNGLQGTCIITASYEARSFGIQTGMHLKEAQKLCPYIIQRPARPERYTAISQRIMNILYDITPDVEVFSIDEAFLDVTFCQRLWGNPIEIGKKVKQKIYDVSGLLCSIGISGDKTTSKYAAKCQKPNGFTVITPWEAKERLRYVPVTDLCGIADGIGKFLARYGVKTCGDMEKLPISVLARRFGNVGRRIWYMCQGQDPEPLHQDILAPQSMGHGKVIPPNTKDKKIILTYLLHMSEKLAARLRRHDLQAQHFFVDLRSYSKGWLGSQIKNVYPTHDSRDIFKLCKIIYFDFCADEAVSQVQVTALDPKPQNNQLDFFQFFDFKREEVNNVLDAVNNRYGEFMLAPARLLHRSSMPNVIAPSWKPQGHRQTIC
jgi:DNA polymerase IV